MLNYLNGMENTNMNGLLNKFTTLKNNAIQKLPTPIKKIVDAGGKVASVGVKFSLTVPRAAFLLLVRTNFLHTAENVEKAIRKNRNAVLNWWKDFGGDFNELLKITNLGIKAGEKGKASALTGEPVSTSAAVVSATPITSSFVVLLKGLGVSAVTAGVTALTKGITSSADELLNKGKDGLTKALNDGKLPDGASGTVIITPPGANPKEPVKTTEVTPVETTEKKSNMPLILGGIAVLGLGAFFLLKKKK
jgi:LPXTG-motif cell wall-anchored protein